MHNWIGPRIQRNNNFDLIRLFAAAQVVLSHSINHLNAPIAPNLMSIIDMFAGVPIFFYISGILVTSSLAARDLRPYARARFRRIFPGLWLAFALALVILIIFGQIGSSEIKSLIFWIWSFTQMTVFQFFNPEMFRDFGVSVVNGSLWTIPVEVGFYFILPVLVWSARSSTKRLSWILGIAGGLSMLLAHWLKQFGSDPSIVIKLLSVSPAPHLWLFSAGALTFIHFKRILDIMNRVAWWVPLVVFIIFGQFVAPLLPAFLADVVSAVLMFSAIIGVALIAPSVVGILKGNDISYGIYVYHMLAVNVFVEMGVSGWIGVLATFCATTTVAYASWKLLEQPILHRS